MTGTVLVTGASGFIGRDLVVRLAASGWRVLAATREPRTYPTTAGVEPIAVGNLARPFDWAPLVSGVSHVVHLAGIAHATSTIAEATYMAVNAESTRNLAGAARHARVERVVMISSVRAQCGPTARGALSETDEPAPTDAYGRSKLAGEQALATTLEGRRTNWCVLRPVVVYGPGVKANMHALARLAALPVPLPIGALEGRRSLLGLPNLATAVMHALTSPAVSRGVYLLADPEPLTIPEIVCAMRRGRSRQPLMFSVPLAPVRLAAAALGKAGAWERLAGDLVVSTARLQASGWRPLETASEGVERWVRVECGASRA